MNNTGAVPSVTALLTNQLYGLGGSVSQTIYDSSIYQEIACFADIARQVAVKQLSEVNGIGLHFKTGTIVFKFYQLASVVDGTAKAIFAGFKESSTFAGAFGAVAVSCGVLRKIDQKLGEFCNNVFVIPAPNGEGSSVDATGAMLTAIGQITYLFSRAMIVLNFAKDNLYIPGLEPVTSALSVPNQVLFFVGGVSQAAVFGVRLITGGAVFAKEGDDKLCDTANCVMDVFKFCEGLSWMAEASVMLIGCANPWVPLATVAVSTGLKLAQVYVIPFVQAYTAPPAPTLEMVQELLARGRVSIEAALLRQPGIAKALIGATATVNEESIAAALNSPAIAQAIIDKPNVFNILSRAVAEVAA